MLATVLGWIPIWAAPLIFERVLGTVSQTARGPFCFGWKHGWAQCLWLKWDLTCITVWFPWCHNTDNPGPFLEICGGQRSQPGSILPHYITAFKADYWHSHWGSVTQASLRNLAAFLLPLPISLTGRLAIKRSKVTNSYCGHQVVTFFSSPQGSRKANLLLNLFPCRLQPW